MQRFPYITDYVNDVFAEESKRWDYRFLRPPILVVYFLMRVVLMPLKFVIHRVPYGFEHWAIDYVLSFGMKHFATVDAARMVIRHVQIEPLLYRFLLTGHPEPEGVDRDKKFCGIDADFGVSRVKDIYWNNLTISHDELSYEIIERFDRETFLANLDELRRTTPEDHERFSKGALEEVDKHSLKILGTTNVVMLIVLTITIFADLRTAMKALNSFDSDSILLWCMKHIYRDDPEVLIDLDFFMQETANRGHYSSSAFLSNPSQYLYYHVVFDEFAYETLRSRRPTIPSEATA